MPIRPVCDKCGDELQDFGALIIGPTNEENLSKKYHICQNCYTNIVSIFSGRFDNNYATLPILIGPPNEASDVKIDDITKCYEDIVASFGQAHQVAK